MKKPTRNYFYFFLIWISSLSNEFSKLACFSEKKGQKLRHGGKKCSLAPSRYASATFFFCFIVSLGDPDHVYQRKKKSLTDSQSYEKSCKNYDRRLWRGLKNHQKTDLQQSIRNFAGGQSMVRATWNYFYFFLIPVFTVLKIFLKLACLTKK